MAVMVPLTVSHDGAIHKVSIQRWKTFAPDINVDWVRIGQNVLRYNVVIVGKFFNKGSWVSNAWRKVHPEGLAEGLEGPRERIPMMEERREQLHLHHDGEGTVCVRPPGTPPPRSARLTPVRGETQIPNVRANQPT